jgi:hypothetical protein
MCYFSTPDQDSRSHHRTSSLPPHVPLFTPSSVTPESAQPEISFEEVSSVDFGHYVDSTPLTVHPHLPLETVMEMFKKLGPRVVLVELRGKVCGLVTVKDVLKYQFKVENEGRPRVERASGAEERVWGFIQSGAKWTIGIWNKMLRRGRPATPDVASRVLLEEDVELVDRRDLH